MVLYQPEEDESITAANRRWWTEKHPGACPECGSHDGMESWYTDELVGLDGWAKDLRWYKRPGIEACRYTPCWACDTYIEGYVEIDYAEVRWFAQHADPMEPDYHALAREPERGDEWNAAEAPAVQ